MDRTLIAGLALVAFAGTAVAETQQVHVFLHDYLHITPETISAKVGDTLQLTIENPLEPEKTEQGKHDLDIPDLGIDMPLLDPGQSVPRTVALAKAGTFEYYCSVPGHKEAGMVGTLVVQGEPEATDKASPAGAFLGVVGALAVAAASRVRRR